MSEIDSAIASIIMAVIGVAIIIDGGARYDAEFRAIGGRAGNNGNTTTVGGQ